MKSVSSEYRVEVDAVTAEAWPGVIGRFADASLYQLWNDGSGQDVSRMLLKKDQEVVAATEVRLFMLPVVGGGIAYVFWGPLWRLHSGEADAETFREALRALVAEYVERRHMVLRINPRCFGAEDQRMLQILAEEGFSNLPQGAPRQSLVMNLSAPLADLRAGLDKKWRNCLSKAERSGLTVASGTSLAIFDEFTTVYARMLERKQFTPTADIQKHRRLQQRLPEALKMGVVVARQNGAPCAGAIYSAIGNTALYLFGGTDEVGMQSSASYLVQWQIVQELIGRQVAYYDLNGINPDTNPGTYHFKKGLAGKLTPEVTFAPQVQAHHASLANQSILLLDRLRLRIRASRARGAAASA
jgi:hypothetical protein